VKSDWQYVLNETSVEFLLACRLRERTQLLKVIEELADNPSRKGDYEAKDKSGRPIEVMLAGQFLISYWSDHFVKELRIIKIERV
jgi:hypothetical protein